MDNTLDEVLKRLRRSPLYPELFHAVYGDTVISGQRFLKAISAFMLTLVSADARYDRMKRGELTFTEQEANGYRLFQEHCNACHREPLFTNYAYANNGLLPDTAVPDAGRYRITRVASDSLQFKVPSLRNLEYSYPYMHDGRFKTLSPELQKPIVLRPQEKVDLQAFLLTLSDSAFVFDTSHAFPWHLFFGKR
jgi:cytochrome c peroxidase